jgi:hypothetical protein
MIVIRATTLIGFRVIIVDFMGISDECRKEREGCPGSGKNHPNGIRKAN